MESFEFLFGVIVLVLVMFLIGLRIGKHIAFKESNEQKVPAYVKSITGIFLGPHFPEHGEEVTLFYTEEEPSKGEYSERSWIIMVSEEISEIPEAYHRAFEDDDSFLDDD